jgi:hypothetical protein
MTGIVNSFINLQWQPNLPAGSFMLPDGYPVLWRGRMLRHRPRGYTDGMSDPKAVQFLNSSLNPFGWAMRAAVPHDGGYHRALDESFDNGRTWLPITLSKDDCDLMFKEILDAIATTDAERAEAILFYNAVKYGGQAAFDEGGRKPPTLA